jgi:GNAT superfamily N-acetyltransferase
MPMAGDAPLLIQTFFGTAMRPYLPALARLRTTVFREWPYLYDGDTASEERHLEAFITADDAALTVAFDGEAVVGCSTSQRLSGQTEQVRAPFLARGLDCEQFCYFGESVLLRDYRGRGAGVAFFRAREHHAGAMEGCDYAVFCGVIRPEDHPLRPAGAGKLDSFWRHRGFVPMPGMVCTMRWKQVDTHGEVANHLAFWVKSTSGAPLP